MTYPKNLADDAKVYDVFLGRPQTFTPFTETCEQIMRGRSPLSAGQRELIGSYVSRLNSCPYCHDVHNEAVKAYGFDSALTQQLVDNLDSADVDDQFRTLLRFVRKITEGAYRVSERDYEQLYAAGWDDDAIHDAVIVTCLFNFMNRLVSSFGIEADDAYLALAGPRIKEQGYSASLENLAESAG
ncbi:MAG: peroxidase-related enzyme [Gammaproteobacteria bacterium]|nr:peroxidase-related enzyme [Gammaproteobacteria bacterium]